LALAVPLSRFTPQVGGGSAFFVRQHYTFMKMQRLMRLQVWMAIVFVSYTLFSGYLIFSLPPRDTMTRLYRSHPLGEREAQFDDLPQLQSDFRGALGYMAEVQRDRNQLLQKCLGASVAIVGFSGWSIFVISRIKREVDHVA